VVTGTTWSPVFVPDEVPEKVPLCVASVPRPRFDRAVDALVRSERLLAAVSFAARSVVRFVIFDSASAGTSAATIALHVGAAEPPEVGPARMQFASCAESDNEIAGVVVELATENVKIDATVPAPTLVTPTPPPNAANALPLADTFSVKPDESHAILARPASLSGSPTSDRQSKVSDFVIRCGAVKMFGCERTATF